MRDHQKLRPPQQIEVNKMPDIRADRWVLMIVLVAVSVRIGVLSLAERFVQVHDLIEVADSVGYQQLANNLITQGSFRFATGGPTAFRMPGYPLVLAGIYAIGANEMAMRVIQIGCELLTISLVYIAAMLVSNRRFVAIIASLIIALHPWLVVTSLTLIPDTLATTLCAALLVLSLLILEADRLRDRKTFEGLLALMTTLAVLVVFLKPTLVIFGFLLLVFFILNSSIGRDWRSIVLVGAITVILIAPWVVRNFVVFGAFIPLTTSDGANLYGGNNPEADGGYVSTLPFVLPDLTEPQSDARFQEMAMSWMRNNPQDFLSLLPRKAIQHFSPLALGTGASPHLSRMVWRMLWGAYVSFYLLVLLGCYTLARSRDWRHLILLCLLPLAVLLPSLIAFGATRFILPSLPALAILSALGLSILFRPLNAAPSADHHAQN